MGYVKMNDMDKLEKIINALSEYFPYDKRVDDLI